MKEFEDGLKGLQYQKMNDFYDLTMAKGSNLVSLLKTHLEGIKNSILAAQKMELDQQTQLILQTKTDIITDVCKTMEAKTDEKLAKLYKSIQEDLMRAKFEIFDKVQQKFAEYQKPTTKG